MLSLTPFGLFKNHFAARKYAAGGGVKGGKKYSLKSVSCEIVEDSYEEGEIGGSFHSFDYDINETYNSKKDLINKMNEVMNTKYKEEHFDWEVGEGKNIQTDVLVSYEKGRDWFEFELATEKEKELWKKGEMKLYNAHYWFDVTPYYEADEFAAGGGVKGGKKYSLKSVSCEIVEDSYEEGEIGGSFHSFDYDINETYNSKKDLINKMNEVMNTKYKEEHFDWEVGEGKNIQTDVLVSYEKGRDWFEFELATEKEKELWKKGEMKLYNAHYWFDVTPYYEADEFAAGGKVKKYKLGDKWSEDFDYRGMLEEGLKADTSWSIDNLEKLKRSFTDVNYHSQGGILYKAIEAMKAENVKEANDLMNQFHQKVKDELAEFAAGGGVGKDVGTGIDFQSKFSEKDRDIITEDVQSHVSDMVKQGYSSGELTDGGTKPHYKGWWEVSIEKDDNDEDIRNEEVAKKIAEGYTSGYYPTFTFGANIWK